MDTTRETKGFENFTESANSVWTKKLVSEFHTQNNRVFKHTTKEMDTPNFQITNSTAKWGTWDPQTKTISISRHLLHNYSWDAVVHTLKHEMAHMIVTEIFPANQYASHGEAFKKACDIMGIDSDATHSSGFKDDFRLSEKEKILSTIYKLFALGQSNYENEAKMAVAKAYQLMFKHNISFSEMPNQKHIFTSRPVGLSWPKIPSYVKKLARIIENYYFVKHIYMYARSDYRSERDVNYRFVEFYGKPENLDIAEYVFHFLINEGERQWALFQKTDEFKNRHNKTQKDESYDWDYAYDYRKKRRAAFSKIAFIEGVFDGFSTTLAEQKTEVIKNVGDDCKAVVLANDKILEDNYTNHYRPKSWHSSRSYGNRNGYHNGHSVGKDIRISPAVHSASNSGILLEA